MLVSLTPKLEELIRRKMASGLYGDESEVVREALPLLQARDEAEQGRLEELRKALTEGEASGIAADFSMDDLTVELDEEARAEGLVGA